MAAIQSHLAHAKPRTLDAVKRRYGAYEELDYNSLNFELTKASKHKPILSCGYAHCSALILFTPHGAAAMSHMLTIKSEHSVVEYLEEMLRDLALLGPVDKSSLEAVIIGGAGIDLTKNVCKRHAIRVIADFYDQSEKGFDIVMLPGKKEIRVFCERDTYSWLYSTNVFSKA